MNHDNSIIIICGYFSIDNNCPQLSYILIKYNRQQVPLRVKIKK